MVHPDRESPAADAHARPADALLDALRSGPQGLAENEAGSRLTEYGPNQLPEPPRDGPLKRLLLQFHNVLIYVLLGSAVITALLRHWADTGVILAVVVINAVLGFVQEGKAEKALGAIRRMLAPVATVVRDGTRRSLPAEQLVPGDIV